MTRNDYLTAPDQVAAHRRYYAQFVYVTLPRLVAARIGEKELLTAKDKKNLNDIPLNRWDALSELLNTPKINSKLKELNDFPVLSVRVCILKEAAKQWLEEEKEESHSILPYGIIESSPGIYEVRCCHCGEWSEIPCDLSEIPQEGYDHYCGRSPSCCP